MAPVGEAFRELARDGLIEMEPGWGARVRRVDLESLRNQHILRVALECEAVRWCTDRATEAQVAELEQVAHKLDRMVESRAIPKKASNASSQRDRHGEPRAIPEEIFELDSHLHMRIAQLSGAASLVEALRANQILRLLARGSVIAHNKERPTGSTAYWSMLSAPMTPTEPRG